MIGFKRKLWHRSDKLSDNMLKTPASRTSEVLLAHYRDRDFAKRFGQLASREDEGAQLKWHAQQLQDL